MFTVTQLMKEQDLFVINDKPSEESLKIKTKPHQAVRVTPTKGDIL